METLTAINRWLAKQHVVTWCVHDEGELWCILHWLSKYWTL